MRRGLWIALSLILGAAFALRMVHIRFGFPALLDPDEPIFILTTLKLLRDGTLNPGWFGHPGTTTIYALAVTSIATFGAWHLTGRFPTVAAFGQAVYADPSLFVLPGRFFILACGLATVLLCFLLARRLFGDRVGLIASALLTFDPVHIRYSQIIRTDMHATVFVLLELLAAVAIVRTGRRRAYLWAALWLGFAVATKWPAAAAAAGTMAAAGYRWWAMPDGRRRTVANVALFAAGSVIALFIASPYLFLDIGTVLSNIHGEERPIHLGATGSGLLGNIGWYLRGALLTALGPVGLGAAAAGAWIGMRRSTEFAVVVMPTAFTFIVLICAQALVWERWITPLLPLATIAAAVGVDAACRAAFRHLPARLPRAMVAGAIAAVIAIPLLLTIRVEAAERAIDTRTQATAWARRHVAPGSSVAVEHFAFDVLAEPWRLLYPAGDAGCVDVRATLRGQVRYSEIGTWRASRAVVDFGSVLPAQLESCHATWAILVNYRRYLAEPVRFQSEIDNYRRLIAGGRLGARFAPVPGRVGGPVVEVWRLADRPSRQMAGISRVAG